ncbi:transposase [Synechococcus sp. C9]|uniref:transposase n=1 Tax=Synechococcus sp. C9 TaxID=102119 RepID=UPI00403FE95C
MTYGKRGSTVSHNYLKDCKKKSQWTTLIIVDSQAVKNTCNASIDAKGYCFYKATHGIKRHLAVDTLGFPFFTHCTPANVPDDVGLVEMLTLNMDYFRAKPVTIPKITILLDRGYHINFLIKNWGRFIHKL